MRKIPSVNLMEVKYLLPMVGGSIDGVYEIKSFRFSSNRDAAGALQSCLRFKLGEHMNFGKQWTKIYKAKMQPGEVISMQDALKLYGEEE